ncbi:hypothetical protein [Amycolatopsis sp. CA-230715]|uniref:hypothetical protein n=1 Tax=Amycolatopsis sp. CA-230715 TaxID=2745196 RepID=UPI001C026CB4|nr:hypothetical protein [Amycolatopsis sp. CA-230715]QWF82524.1 hypothetical protein HUW46_05962 [Amycolatopsis sp. CA-230715]
MQLVENTLTTADTALLEELVDGYGTYTDATELDLQVHAGSDLVACLTCISLTVTISTLIAGCG